MMDLAVALVRMCVEPLVYTNHVETPDDRKHMLTFSNHIEPLQNINNGLTIDMDWAGVSSL
jgi:hypothetical protein